MDRALTAAAVVVLALALLIGPNGVALADIPTVELGDRNGGAPPDPYVPTTVPDYERAPDGAVVTTPPAEPTEIGESAAPTGPESTDPDPTASEGDRATSGGYGTDATDSTGGTDAIDGTGDAPGGVDDHVGDGHLACVSPDVGTGEWVVVVFADRENRTELGNATLEVANEVEEWERGLMGRETLPAGRGMLFEFPDEAPRTFWMKSTLVPLDIVFADGDGVVLNVAHASPEPGVDDDDLRRYASDGEAQYVVEVNRGVANETGIGPGTQLWFEDAEYCR
ncbi:DUF192 domain-containing protein [Halobium salinum]|uniref:DUF192 domain-containing protein n=1 Tax=Halobium salinum TaxID=1364940 RepID=A0ABD5PBN8_9EURY|nr:DUF192 domain-containing protein [Halobium salinum]